MARTKKWRAIGHARDAETQLRKLTTWRRCLHADYCVFNHGLPSTPAAISFVEKQAEALMLSMDTFLENLTVKFHVIANGVVITIVRIGYSMRA